jgi:hypothetical protein
MASHSRGVTGWTESRAPRRSSIIPSSSGIAAISSRVTGRANSSSNAISTPYQRGASRVESGSR